jgi:hypothetical protein
VVEPVSLGVIVAALLARALDRAEDAVADEGAGVLRRLVGVVRRRFSDSGHEEGLLALDRVAEAPHNQKRVGALAALVGEYAGQDDNFRAELEGLVEQARLAGVDRGAISQVAAGDYNVQIGGIRNSSIELTDPRSPREDRAPRPSK